ncbi:MAG: hypothetical protein M1608_04500, partial [Candidatus Omnitrophica bacterium]|nr:hypothetical protein [Candidatus Omnitrophota bacterium]
IASGTRFDNVTEEIRSGEMLPEGGYMVASVVRAGTSPWFGGKTYVDLLYPGVTEKFLEITMGSYRREIGDQFGRLIPGVFTDEPNIRPAGGLPWTDSLPAAFEKRWGYRLTDHLPSLDLRDGDWRRVRHNYYQVLLEQFIEHWARPYHDYCAQHHLEFTGHYWEHDWPICLNVPDNMAMYAWHQRPAIDILMNQYQEDAHAQFGNVRAVKELSSVANQLGLQRTLCEAYGAGGWDLRFQDMKRIGDWLYVLGVNTLDQHLSYITLRGARKRDHPQSFSYHEPWWQAYHVSAEYFARLSAALSQGEQINPVLLLEPTTTAWMYNSEKGGEPHLTEIGKTFQSLVMSLERAQVEYDIGCEDILARHGSVNGGALKVGERSYGVVVLPPLTENLDRSTIELLEPFLAAGGTVLCCGEPPSRIDGASSERARLAAHNAGWNTIEAEALPAELNRRTGSSGLVINRAPDDRGILFHQRRHLDDGELLFLVNTSAEFPSSGSIISSEHGMEEWDPRTGRVKGYPFEETQTGVRARFELPPSGSRLLFLASRHMPALVAQVEKSTLIQSAGSARIIRTQPNALVLDYVNITAGGETRTNLYFYLANQFAFQKNGMERDPWDSAVQFRDEYITRKFGPESGFEADYHFVIQDAVPANLSVVVERPDLYGIFCNGQPVTPIPGAWWLDKAFGRISLAAVARVGENVITLKATPFTLFHELEPVYVLGDFRLEPAKKGFVLTPDNPLRLGRWNAQGQPFYSAGVSYTQEFNLGEIAGQYRVKLTAWYGSVARVAVNGQPAGYVSEPPWECEITNRLKPGTNKVEVTVIGTLKNTLGPHHAGPGLGSAWPGMFQTGPDWGPPPGDSYATVGYGLFEPFLLRQTSP